MGNKIRKRGGLFSSRIRVISQYIEMPLRDFLEVEAWKN